MNGNRALALTEEMIGYWPGEMTREAQNALLKVLERTDEDVAGRAIKALTNTEQFRPSPARLLQAIKSFEAAPENRTKHECGTCDGTWWVTAPPVEENGTTYAQVRRCPDCFERGVPSPVHYVKPARMPEHLRGLFRNGKKPAMAGPSEIGEF